MVRLSDVAEQCLGKMLDTQKNKGRMLPYLANPNVRWFDVDLTNLKGMRFEEHELERYGLTHGDVLICEGGEAGRAAIWESDRSDVKFQKAIHRVRTGPELYNRYLVHQLMADYQSGLLADYYTGATIKHLTGQDLARYAFPLPPLDEQRRIADVLDRAEALRAKRRAALEELDVLVESIFLDLFGTPSANYKGMRKAPIGDLVSLKSGEFLPTSRMSEAGAFPVFGGNGISGYHDHFLFEEPQIIIGRVGAYCGCIHVSPAKSWITDNALYVSARSPVVELEYLSYALKYAKLNKYSSQSGQPLVSGSRIYPIQILVPDLGSQREFARRIAAVRTLANAYRASLVETDALAASLQHRAFRGEL